MSTPLDDLPDIDAANVVRCARTLLRRPLLRGDGPDGELLALVYRHRFALQDLFAGLLGYRLVVERRFARLYKSGPGVDDTRGVPGMSPRGYAYLALTLGVLTGVGRQALLSRLVSDVRAAAVEAGIDVVDDVVDRRALTAALRHLVSLGVLHETEGQVGADLQTEALITIDTDLLGQLLTGPVAEADSPERLVALAARPGPRGVEHAVRRRLVETPLVLYADLPPEQADWLRRNQRKESVLLEKCFGLYTESRLEGVLAADPEDYLTDMYFPGSSTVARLALLALPTLLELEYDAEDEPITRADGRHLVSTARLREVLDRLVEDYPAAWSKQIVEDQDKLVTEVTELLRRMGLAVAGEDGWLLNPAAHRWIPEPDGDPEREVVTPTPIEPGEPSWSLFDEETVS
ncbi:TIGR02678 family protein [Umezawaea endophytica]|uniref:TIGR02678 family protein n=1 Tax=Umezawaea endophytica TaxID=1654476 RepID=A0A9X2VXG4_9PSEU|nr:TIGR02678 family protein [Umezawaea endophytica]MCS7484474.1 TIGR02678 family protein [Umezawaea endophytica]